MILIVGLNEVPMDDEIGKESERIVAEKPVENTGVQGGANRDVMAEDHGLDDEESEAEHEDVEVLGNQGEDDPFASGVFDLEHGHPFQPSEGRGENLPWKSYIDSPKEFLTAEILYRFDILERKDREFIFGTYRLELKGFRGGVWTITVGEQLVVVNRREEAEVTISMQQQDFIQLVNGDLNPQLAIVAEKIKITGDIRKAIAFQKVLAPSDHDRQ